MNVEILKKRLAEAYPDGAVDAFDLTGDGDHFEVSVESKAFKGLSRIQQHQAVMAVFQAELKTGEVHALSIKTRVKE